MDHTINFNITGTELEKNVAVNNAMVYFIDTYWLCCFGSSIVYVVLIFLGRRIMTPYQRFGLTKTLALWSGLLAVFSLLGTIRMLPNLVYALSQQSFHDSVCTSEWTEIPVVRFWISLFTLSKIIELGDTAFIVLRKQPLIFLHWYHHITVLVYTWYSYVERTSSGRWYITMNYAVHSVMYAYYAARALKYRAPSFLKMSITLFQISQMVVGVYIGIYVYRLKRAGIPCGVTDQNMYLSFLMYLSYFVLFAKFFYDAYLQPPKSLSSESKKSSNGMNGHSHTNGYHHTNGVNSHKNGVFEYINGSTVNENNKKRL